MKDFYTAFYSVVSRSPAHHAFCERAFGRDLCQHGFADMGQLDLLMQATRLGANHRALDLGCGNGMIAEYLSDCTGAHITGLDYIPEAIYQAQQRTAAKADRLAFQVGDINHLELPPTAFDLVLSIDTMYFSEDYRATLRALAAALRPGGQMGIFYTHGREPGTPADAFSKNTLSPDNTPLGQALSANGLTFCTWDLTRQDYEGAQRRKQILLDLKPQFEADGALFIYENRMGEANGISQAIADEMHARYFYHVRLPVTGE